MNVVSIGYMCHEHVLVVVNNTVKLHDQHVLKAMYLQSYIKNQYLHIVCATISYISLSLPTSLSPPSLPPPSLSLSFFTLLSASKTIIRFSDSRITRHGQCFNANIVCSLLLRTMQTITQCLGQHTHCTRVRTCVTVMLKFSDICLLPWQR